MNDYDGYEGIVEGNPVPEIQDGEAPFYKSPAFIGLVIGAGLGILATKKVVSPSINRVAQRAIQRIQSMEKGTQQAAMIGVPLLAGITGASIGNIFSKNTMEKKFYFLKKKLQVNLYKIY